MCVCPGDCEGGPECLDDEGGPLDLYDPCRPQPAGPGVSGRGSCG
jgi:hypothetical protein